MAIERVRKLGRYAPLSATYYEDDAIGEAGPDAEMLYVRGLAYSSSRDADGFMTRMQVLRFVANGLSGAEDRIADLVRVGLWEESDGGYRIRAWLKWNKSAEEITNARRTDAARKTARPKAKPVPDGIRAESDRNPHGDGTESDPTPDGIRPPSERSEPEGSAESERNECEVGSDSERIPPSSAVHSSAVHSSTEELPPAFAALQPAPPTLVPEIIEEPRAEAGQPKPDNAGTILAELIDHCAAQGVTLTGRIKGQYAKRIKEALDSHVDPDVIKRALASMLADNTVNQPSWLDNRIVAAQTGPERRKGSAGFVEVNGMLLSPKNVQALEQAERFRRMEAAGQFPAIEGSLT